MKKYYKLLLNCARVRTICSSYKDCGFIEILPLKSSIEKKGLFGIKYVPVIKYSGWFHVIAEGVDDHFEDIILGKKIEYDPNGLRDITSASIEELDSQLDIGLTCYKFTEIEPEIALYYMEKIKTDQNILEKYISELEELEKKENVINEIKKRMEDPSQLPKEERSDKVAKQRTRIIKSA